MRVFRNHGRRRSVLTNLPRRHLTSGTKAGKIPSSELIVKCGTGKKSGVAWDLRSLLLDVASEHTMNVSLGKVSVYGESVGAVHAGA